MGGGGALLALMYLDQDGNIVCNQSIYAAIRRSEENFILPMSDSASYIGLGYDIETYGLEDDFDTGIRYSREFIAGGASALPSIILLSIVIVILIASKLVSALSVCIDKIIKGDIL